MDIEHFIALSIGKWRSMRSGHSLAFQHFEEVLSEITIEAVSNSDPKVCDMLAEYSTIRKISAILPFKMCWEAESDWDPDDSSQILSGSCTLVPIPENHLKGIILRSIGYAEAEEAISEYKFQPDGTFTLQTKYEQSVAEERIWFASDNVRCRSSVIKSLEGTAILQVSFASEVRKI